MEWILASASPRRRTICDRLGLSYRVIPATAELPLDPALPVEEAVCRVARAKAESVAAAHPDAVVIGADTVVVAPSGVLGKPRSTADSAAMLSGLQGREHRVMTGVWVCYPGGGDGFTDVARVTFYPMTADDIATYVATGETMDKAGSYAIQGIGMRYIRSISGDFYTVMGLPGARLFHFLRDLRLLEK